MKTINYALMLSNSISDEIKSISADLLEATMDELLNDGIIKQIPIISTFMSLYNIGNSIREKHYISKLAAFVFELNNNIADKEKAEYYKRRLSTDIKKRNKEISYILVLIDRYIQIDKANMLAKLYLSYLDEMIDWMSFAKYVEVIDRFLPGDYNVLKSGPKYETKYDIETDAIQRLIALGLVIEGIRKSAVQEQDGSLHIDPPEIFEKIERNYKRTEFGDILIDILENKYIN